MKSVEYLIARRYLLSKKGLRFINVISFISVGGIAIGVAALFVALAVFNGFSGVVTSVLLGFDPHIRIEKPGGMTEKELAVVESVLAGEQGVAGTSAFISGKAMLVAPSFNRVVFLRGADESSIGGVSGVKDKIVLGKFGFRDTLASNGIVIGLALADRLASIPGNELLIISPYGFQSAISGLEQPQTMKYRVLGIYESGNKEYDANYAFVSIADAQKLFHMENMVSGVELRLKDLAGAGELKERLSASLPAGMVVATWYDLHETLYRVMKIERWSAYVLLTLIIVVASFNLLGSLTMGVIEKRRDVAILKSLGMASRTIIRLFMVEGILIGLAGTVIGAILGMIVVFLQSQYHLFPLDTSVYIIPAVPVEIHWWDLFSISAASLGLSYLASYYPAKRAAATLPADALRWE
jgi:lipoprotein-releasing system permease protein